MKILNRQNFKIIILLLLACVLFLTVTYYIFISQIKENLESNSNRMTLDSYDPQQFDKYPLQLVSDEQGNALFISKEAYSKDDLLDIYVVSGLNGAKNTGFKLKNPVETDYYYRFNFDDKSNSKIFEDCTEFYHTSGEKLTVGKVDLYDFPIPSDKSMCDEVDFKKFVYQLILTAHYT